MLLQINIFSAAKGGGGIRPDADGVLTYGEVNGWRRWGNGQPLYADFNKITSGVVIDKFIEKDNHGKKKVIIKELNKTYEVSFTFYANWTDFEGISIGDSITKPPKSFHLRVNHNKDIQLDFQCDYSKD